MKMRRNKGGAPTKEKTALWEQLHKTGLFNRSSFTYVNIEKALDELSPARAFEMFSRLCMIRDSTYIHQLEPDSEPCTRFLKKFKKIKWSSTIIKLTLKDFEYQYNEFYVKFTHEKQECFLQTIGEDTILNNKKLEYYLKQVKKKSSKDTTLFNTNKNHVTIDDIFEKPPNISSTDKLLVQKNFSDYSDVLKQIKKLSFEVYGIYLLLSDSNNIVDTLNNDKLFGSDTDPNFSIYSEIKLKHIFNQYSEEQQKDIIAVCLDNELYENSEFEELYDNNGGSERIEELIFSILKEHYPINLNLLKDPNNLFYLPHFDTEEHKAFISRTVEEDMKAYSTTTIHSGKNIYLRVNPDKPLEHYQEMFKLLQIDFDINTNLHSKTFSNVLAHNTLQKSIAGKMTDLLYIYDNRLYGYSIAWTIDELTSYWREKNPQYWKTKTMISRSTYSTYKKIINNFIDNKRYKL